MMIKYSKEQLFVAVNNSESFAGVLRYLRLKQNGGTQAYIKKRIILLGIDYSHFTGQAHNRGKLSLSKKPWQEVLKNRPDTDRREAGYRLRRALIESGREYKCQECKIGNEYNKKPITLDVDHIDGNWTNHDKENLRFLCPNCHSQTPNFGNKKKKPNPNEHISSRLYRKRREKKKYFCMDCKNEIKCSRSPRCRNCCKIKVRVVTRPNKEELEQIIYLLPFTEIAKIYGVTDNSVRKWCKFYNLEIPRLPTGFWLRKNGD